MPMLSHVMGFTRHSSGATSSRRSIAHMCKDLPLQSCGACWFAKREPAGGQTGASAGRRAPGPQQGPGQAACTRHRTVRRAGPRTGPLGRLGPRVPQHDHARAGARGRALRTSRQDRRQSSGHAAPHHGGTRTSARAGAYDHRLRYEHRGAGSAGAQRLGPACGRSHPRAQQGTARPAAPPAAAPRRWPARLPRRVVAHTRRDRARKLEIRVFPAAAALACRRRAVRRGRALIRQAGRDGGRQIVILVAAAAAAAAAGWRRRRARAQRDQRAGLRNGCVNHLHIFMPAAVRASLHSACLGWCDPIPNPNAGSNTCWAAPAAARQPSQSQGRRGAGCACTHTRSQQEPC